MRWKLEAGSRRRRLVDAEAADSDALREMTDRV